MKHLNLPVILSLLLSFFFELTLSAQDTTVISIYHKYWVQFSNKNNNPYSLERPHEFLSQTALTRRQKQNITLNNADLPVSPAYVDSVISAGAKILLKSKWFNGVCIETTDSLVLQQLATFSFVSYLEPVAAFRKTVIDSAGDTSGIESITLAASPVLTKNLPYDQQLYGTSFNQINMLNGQYLHELGFRGENKTIAVLDAGFFKVNEYNAFDSLWLNQRIVGYRDFVDLQDDSIFKESAHGLSVLSIMGGNLPGEIVGTAPASDYWLMRTEEGATEYQIEEYNWTAGAELADSAGVDIINSSLGYSTFDDPAMSYTYADMNGNTTVISRAADIAATKGMIVVTSAGNLGSSLWRYISAPADGHHVVSIGALNHEGHYTAFSSRGPTVDGRVKPDLSAQGRDVLVVNRAGALSTGSGTSFASPIIAGLFACLWQAFPEKTSREIIENVLESASHFMEPNDSLGYGIPDFRLAFLKMQEESGSPYQRDRLPLAFPNPFTNELHVMLFARNAGVYSVELFDTFGKRITREERHLGELRFHDFFFSGLEKLPKGIYILRAGSAKDVKTVKVVKG